MKIEKDERFATKKQNSFKVVKKIIIFLTDKESDYNIKKQNQVWK